jgi:hypothetical protein
LDHFCVQAVLPVDKITAHLIVAVLAALVVQQFVSGPMQYAKKESQFDLELLKSNLMNEFQQLKQRMDSLEHRRSTDTEKTEKERKADFELFQQRIAAEQDKLENRISYDMLRHAQLAALCLFFHVAQLNSIVLQLSASDRKFRRFNIP